MILIDITLNLLQCPKPLHLISLYNAVIPSLPLSPMQSTSLGIWQEIGLEKACAVIQDEACSPDSYCAFLSVQKKSNNFLFVDIWGSCVKMKLSQATLDLSKTKDKRAKRPTHENAFLYFTCGIRLLPSKRGTQNLWVKEKKGRVFLIFSSHICICCSSQHLILLLKSYISTGGLSVSALV